MRLGKDKKNKTIKAQIYKILINKNNKMVYKSHKIKKNSQLQMFLKINRKIRIYQCKLLQFNNKIHKVKIIISKLLKQKIKTTN